MKKLESLKSNKLNLKKSNTIGGLSPAAAAMLNRREWVTRTNVFVGALGATNADVGVGNDPFGDLSLDSN